MKKKLLSILMIICLLVFTACGSNEKQEDNNLTSTTTPSEAVTETPAPTEEPTQAPTETPTEAPTEVPTETPTELPTEAPTEAPEEIPTEVPTEAPIPGTENRSFNDEYDYILEAYATALTQYENPDDSDTLKFNLACIDEDDIPELLVSTANYHGAGVTISKYDINEGGLRSYEPYGAYGGCSYNPFNNRVITFDYSMGYEVLTHSSITDQGFSIISSTMFDENELKFYIDGEEVDEDTYFEKNDELMAFHNTNMFFDYNTAPTYSPGLDILSVLKDMANAALNCKEYYLPVDFVVDDLNGDWELLSATMYDSAADTTTYSQDMTIATGSLYVNLNDFNHFWTHFNDNFYQEYELSYNVVNEKLIDQANYADWYVQFTGATSNDEYYATLFSEQNTTYVLFRHITLTSDTDTLTYDMKMYRSAEENDYTTNYATLRFDETNSDLDNDIAAFTATAYIWVTPDDTDLIEQYGLAPDLDGYDYEIVTPDQEDYTVYVDIENATFQVLDWNSETLYTTVDYDGFIDHLNNNCMGEICVTYQIAEVDADGKVFINSLVEDYTG